MLGDTAALLSWNAMEWTAPQHAKSQVDWAGKVLVANQGVGPFENYANWADYDRAVAIINNWRSAHAYPLNTFQTTLRAKARAIDANAVVAQRTKRMWSIWHKLDRFKTMQLSQVQDIGGCRAIVHSMAHAQSLFQSYQKSSVRHIQKRTTDYITTPRESGYRGIHIIWSYNSKTSAKQCYNGLLIEMQIRSELQHSWATTVETVGTLTRQALKSSLGESDWLRFFTLMSSVIAKKEGSPGVPNTPGDDHDLVEELRSFSTRLNASHRLRSFGSALRELEAGAMGEAHFFLLELNPDSLLITGYPANRQKEAQAQYAETEKRIAQDQHSDAVLVSVDSLTSLRKAYPNYFLDAHAFAGLLDDALCGNLSPLDLT